MKKRCRTCSLEKQDTEFYNKGRNSLLKETECKECHRDRNARYISERKVQNKNKDFSCVVKICAECGVEKHSSKFNRCLSSSTGLESRCRDCRRAKREGTYNRPAKITKKKCNKCGKTRRPEDFSKNKRMNDGYARLCKKCASDRHYANYIKIHGRRFSYPSKEERRKRRNELARKRRTNLNYAIHCRLSARLKGELRKLGLRKTKPTCKYGIDIQAIITHLGAKPGDNFHIDHIFPVVAFDFRDPMHIRICYHPTNLRWLSAPENISKHAKYDPVAFAAFFEKTKKLLESQDRPVDVWSDGIGNDF